jgi:transmembrane protein 17
MSLLRSPKKAGAKMIASGLSAVSGRLFPDTRHMLEDEETNTKDVLSVTNTEIASNLPLQMLLYFNVYFALFWGLLVLANMVFRESYMTTNPAYLVLCPLILSVWSIVEPLRLYFGYVGNLQEKVPHLTGFWLLTLLPQIPLAFFFIIAKPITFTPSPTSEAVPIQLSFDRAGSIVLLLMYIQEAIVGYVALRNMVRSQVLKFHMLNIRTSQEAPIPADGAARR